ncbi:MAG: hypothetical protein CMF46_00310 [Legionellales bacterium]|nr:hypothetical protein [Legionellales bacterium]|tara:strand:- start:3552 stop:4085 length:534 start_codon:yes stop_codon:yes gene_type:complete
MLRYLLVLSICLIPAYSFELASRDLQHQVEIEHKKVQAFLDTVTEDYNQSPTLYQGSGHADADHSDAFWHNGNIVYLNNAYAAIDTDGHLSVYVSFKDQQPGISALLKGTELKLTALGKNAQLINVHDGINHHETEITGFLCQRVANDQGKKFATFNVSGNEVNLSHTLPPPYTGCD